MKDERTITQFARVPSQQLWWSAIFGGTFFALGIMLILSLFGVAVGAAASGAQGVGQGVKIWSGIWSLVRSSPRAEGHSVESAGFASTSGRVY